MLAGYLTQISHLLFQQWCLLSQGLNQMVTVEGKKKVDVLTATKDFKKGIYGLQWEHTRGNMEVLSCAALYHTLHSATSLICHLLDDNFVGLFLVYGSHKVFVLLIFILHPYVCFGFGCVVRNALMHCDAQPLDVLHICSF